MDTRKSFEYLINNKKLVGSMNLPANTANVWRNRFKKELITIDKMEEILKQAGFIKKPENWKKPSINPIKK